MANSKRKKIIEYLRDTTLAAITTAGGYNNDIATIERGLRNIQRMADEEFPAIFIPGASEQREDETKVHFTSNMSVFLAAWVKDVVGSYGGVQLLLDNIIEDITKAVYVDETLGGNAINTTISEVDPEDADDGAHGFALIKLDIQYNSLKSSP